MVNSSNWDITLNHGEIEEIDRILNFNLESDWKGPIMLPELLSSPLNFHLTLIIVIKQYMPCKITWPKRPKELFLSLCVRRPLSVCRPSTIRKSLLLWKRSSDFHEILLEITSDGPLSKLCPMTPPSNQDGLKAKRFFLNWRWNF